jgi:cbb3-type cytochrome oxidase subunit 3
MTKYLIIFIVFLVAIMFFIYFRGKKQNKVRELKRDPRTGTFTDI